VTRFGSPSSQRSVSFAQLPQGATLDRTENVIRQMSEIALKDPAVAKQLTDQGFEIVGDTPEHFAKFQQEELARWKKVIETGHITAN